MGDAITFLIDASDGYGVRRATLSLISALIEAGRQTAAISFNDGTIADECRRLGARTAVLNAGVIPSYRRKFPMKIVDFLRSQGQQNEHARRIAAALREVSASKLLVQRGNHIGAAGIAARVHGCDCYWLMPNVVGSHYPLRVNRAVYQYLLWRHGIRPVANSHYTARSLGNWPVKADVLHLGVDPEVFDDGLIPSISRQDLHIADDAIVIGKFANLIPAKGQRELLEAVLSLNPTTPPVHLLLCGGPTESDYARDLRRLIDEAGAGDRVHLLGPVPNPQEYYPMCDVVANASVDAEAFGLSVVEAMMMGKPVLAHALGGPAETVIDGTTGWHVKSPDKDSFKAGLLRALEDRPRWLEMAAAAKAHALDRFSVHRTTENLLAIVGSR